MKVNDILRQVIKKVRTYNNSHTHIVGRDDLPSYVVRYEELLTWAELKHLLAQTDVNLDITHYSRHQRKEVFEPFKNFLNNRWERLKDFSQFHYTHTFDQELTQVCETLATELADLKVFLHRKTNSTPSVPREPHHRYELLMPGINFTNSVTYMNLNLLDAVEKLELHHFILDEELRIIHIKDCLTDARNDLSLKHTSALSVTGTQLRLSTKDYYRVRYHSKATNSAWETIEKINNYRTTLNTVGGALARLMLCLESAGIRGNLGGSDDKAAQEVHKGIKAFYEYFTNLHPQVQQAVLNLKASEDLSGLFEFIFKKLLLMAYWDDEVNESYLSEAEVIGLHAYVTHIAETRRLDRSGEADVINMSFSCVDQMSIKISKIIALGSLILKLSLDSTNCAVSTLDTEDENPEMTALESTLQNSLNAVSTRSTERYSRTDVLTPRVRKALLFDDTKFLNKFSRRVISTPEHFFGVLNYMRHEYHSNFIFDCMKTQALAKLFQNAEALISGFSLLNLTTKEQNEASFDLLISQLGRKKLKKLFTKPDELSRLAKLLSFNLFLNILQKLSQEYVMSMFADTDAVRLFIQPYTEPQKLSLCSFFNIIHIPEREVKTSRFSKIFSFFSKSIGGAQSAFKVYHPRDDKEEKAEQTEQTNKRQRLQTQIRDEEEESMELVRSAPPQGPFF